MAERHRMLAKAERELAILNDELHQAVEEYDVADWARNTVWPLTVNRWIAEVGESVKGSR